MFEDFFYFGLGILLNILNFKGVVVNSVNFMMFLGFNMMGIFMYNVVVVLGVVNLFYFYFGVIEVGIVVEGLVLIGFLMNNYMLYLKVVGFGDMFVIFLGFIYYEMNVGKMEVCFLIVVVSEWFSEVFVLYILFFVKLVILDFVLEKIFKIDGKMINMFSIKLIN